MRKLFGKLTEQSDRELQVAREVFKRSKNPRDEIHLEAVEVEIWARETADEENR